MANADEVMSEHGDYTAPCGCYRHTDHDENGEITGIDEAICRQHLAHIWDVELIDASKHRFKIVLTNAGRKALQDTERTDHV